MLSSDIDDINEMIGVVPECEPYRESWKRIKTALAELGTTPNSECPLCKKKCGPSTYYCYDCDIEFHP